MAMAMAMAITSPMAMAMAMAMPIPMALLSPSSPSLSCCCCFTTTLSASDPLSPCSASGFVPITHILRGSPVRRVRLFANSEENSSSNSSSTQDVPQSMEGGDRSNVSEKKAAARAEVEKGQTTAIITGAIAVILGVAYLILVQLLDSRGTTLVPPPPEAFGL